MPRWSCSGSPRTRDAHLLFFWADEFLLGVSVFYVLVYHWLFFVRTKMIKKCRSDSAFQEVILQSSLNSVEMSRFHDSDLSGTRLLGVGSVRAHQ